MNQIRMSLIRNVHTGFRAFGLLATFAAMLGLPSCRTSVPAIQPEAGRWYLNESMGLGLNFEEQGKGRYIQLDRAIATQQEFKLKGSSQSARLKLKGRKPIKGSISMVHDRIYLHHSGGRFEFMPYKAPKATSTDRYTNQIFTETSRQELVYGYAPGFYSSKPIEKNENLSYGRMLVQVAESVTANLFKNEIPLQMDIYQPVGDAQRLRPLLVLLHGGAFIVGDKRDTLVSSLAVDFAKRGYVVASVNYRMGFVFAPGRYANLERAMFSALQDVRAAIRYLSHYKQVYRIDPDMVFIGGNSAGGILSLLTGFMDETEVWPSARGSVLRMQADLGCLDCATNKLQGPFSIRGLVNMWGAVDDISIIKRSDNIPVLSIHGDKDNIVPYGHDFPFTNVSARATSFFTKKLHGSASILAHAQGLGLNHRLYTFSGKGHEPHFDENGQLLMPVFDTINRLMAGFYNQQLIPPPPHITGSDFVNTNDKPLLYEAQKGFYNQHIFECDSCLILLAGAASVKIIWLEQQAFYRLGLKSSGPHGQWNTNSKTIQLR